MGGGGDQSAEGAQIERPKVSRGMGRGRPHPQPTRESGELSKLHTAGSRVEPRPNTVLVHIKHHRTPVAEVKPFKIIEKSYNKKLRIFLTVRTLRTLYGYRLRHWSSVFCANLLFFRYNGVLSNVVL